jgi:hypothetical protein
MIDPRQTIASKFLLVATRRAAKGSSKEPGTRTIVIESLEAPRRSSPSSAPLISRLTTKSFQRLATIATRSPSALNRPWIVLANLQTLLTVTGFVGLKPNGIEIAPTRPSKLIFQLSTEDEYRLRYLLCQAIDFLTLM